MANENTTTSRSYLDKKSRKEEIKADLDAILDRLAVATEDASDHQLFKSWLDTASRFHRYSWNNSLLIYMQRTDATQVAGKKKWFELGYKLKKGCKAIWIVAPMIIKKEDKKTGDEKSQLVGFKAVPVFDRSDIEERTDDAWVKSGKAPSTLDLHYRSEGCDGGAIEALEAFAKSKGIEVSYVPQSKLGSAKGVSKGGSIEISNEQTGAARAGTLAHEIAHELLHWGEDGKLARDHEKNWREVEAESVSFAIMNAFGIEQPSEFYLAAWGGTKDLVKKSLTRIQKTVHEVLEFVNETAEVAA